MILLSRLAVTIWHESQLPWASNTSSPCPWYVLSSRPVIGFHSFNFLSAPQVKQYEPSTVTKIPDEWKTSPSNRLCFPNHLSKLCMCDSLVYFNTERQPEHLTTRDIFPSKIFYQSCPYRCTEQHEQLLADSQSFSPTQSYSLHV